MAHMTKVLEQVDDGWKSSRGGSLYSKVENTILAGYSKDTTLTHSLAKLRIPLKGRRERERTKRRQEQFP